MTVKLAACAVAAAGSNSKEAAAAASAAAARIFLSGRSGGVAAFPAAAAAVAGQTTRYLHSRCYNCHHRRRHWQRRRHHRGGDVGGGGTCHFWGGGNLDRRRPATWRGGGGTGRRAASASAKADGSNGDDRIVGGEGGRDDGNDDFRFEEEGEGLRRRLPPSPSSRQPRRRDLVRQRMMRLLESPEGSWDASHVDEAERTIRDWTLTVGGAGRRRSSRALRMRRRRRRELEEEEEGKEEDDDEDGISSQESGAGASHPSERGGEEEVDGDDHDEDYDEEEGDEEEDDDEDGGNGEAARACFDLLERVAAELSSSDLLLPRELVEGEEDKEKKKRVVEYWLDGNVPRSTHLLNAALDAWRIGWEREQQQQQQYQHSSEDGGSVGGDAAAKDGAPSSYPSPLAVFERLLRWNHYRDEGGGSDDDDSDTASPVVVLPADARSFGIVMTAIKNSRRIGDGGPDWTRKEIPELCESVINAMLEIPGAAPDTVAVTTALSAWAGSGRPDAPDRAVGLFRHLLLLHEQGAVPLAAPNAVTYNTLIQCLCRSGREGTEDLERAEELLNEMLYSPYPHAVPDDMTYRMLVTGWVDAGSPVRAVKLLCRMIKRYRDGSDTGNFLDATYFSYVISHLIKSAPRGCGGDHPNFRQARQLYDLLLDLYRESDGDGRFQPEVLTTRAMLLLHAKTGRPEDAEELLQRLEKQAAVQDNPRLLPKRGHYREVVFSWTAAAKERKSRAATYRGDGKYVPTDVDPTERAERVLLRMVDVASQRREKELADKNIVDIVLGSWFGNSKFEAPERAENLLYTLLDISEARSNLPHSQLKLGTSSFTHVMKCWGRSKRADAAERAESVLRDLKHRYASSGNVSMRPDTKAYTAVINAWVYCDGNVNASKHIEQLVRDAWDDGYKAGNDDAKPDTKLYGAALHGLARSGDGEAAERILRRMLQDYSAQKQQRGKNRKNRQLVKPSPDELNLVLLAWLRSSDSSSALPRSREVVNSMQQYQIRPNERSLELLKHIKQLHHHSPSKKGKPPGS